MICFSVESDHMLISVESKELVNSVDNPYLLVEFMLSRNVVLCLLMV